MPSTRIYGLISISDLFAPHTHDARLYMWHYNTKLYDVRNLCGINNVANKKKILWRTILLFPSHRSDHVLGWPPRVRVSSFYVSSTAGLRSFIYICWINMDGALHKSTYIHTLTHDVPMCTYKCKSWDCSMNLFEYSIWGAGLSCDPYAISQIQLIANIYECMSEINLCRA